MILWSVRLELYILIDIMRCRPLNYETVPLSLLLVMSHSVRLAHTVNGTACAVPRMVIALCETFQTPQGIVTLPSALHPFLPKHTVTPPPLCRMTWIKDKAYQGTIVK